MPRSALPATGSDRRPGVPGALLLAFVPIWIVAAISPYDRQDWLLENLLVLVALPVLVLGYRRLRFSDGSYVAIFVFLVLHEIGAHYTYSEVPYERWLRDVLDVPADTVAAAGRNHYDRALHFLYGLLITPAVVELVDARARPTPLWRAMLAVAFVTSHSVVYELVEWAAASVFGGELGVAYLGTQGDPWDAQKDMLLALLGSVLAIALVTARGFSRKE